MQPRITRIPNNNAIITGSKTPVTAHASPQSVVIIDFDNEIPDENQNLSEKQTQKYNYQNSKLLSSKLDLKDGNKNKKTEEISENEGIPEERDMPAKVYIAKNDTENNKENTLPKSTELNSKNSPKRLQTSDKPEKLADNSDILNKKDNTQKNENFTEKVLENQIQHNKKSIAMHKKGKSCSRLCSSRENIKNSVRNNSSIKSTKECCLLKLQNGKNSLLSQKNVLWEKVASDNKLYWNKFGPNSKGMRPDAYNRYFCMSPKEEKIARNSSVKIFSRDHARDFTSQITVIPGPIKSMQRFEEIKPLNPINPKKILEINKFVHGSYYQQIIVFF